MSTYRYIFTSADAFRSALDTLVLARIAVASAVGDVRAMLELECKVDHSSRAVLIDSTSKTGQMLSRILMGFLARELPSGAFKVSMVRPAAGNPDELVGGVSTA